MNPDGTGLKPLTNMPKAFPNSADWGTAPRVRDDGLVTDPVPIGAGRFDQAGAVQRLRRSR
jgi:hypothetical protein